MTVWTIVVAAGRGTRFGGPKSGVEVAGRRVVDWSLRSARAVSDGVVLVVPPGEEFRPVAGADLVVGGRASRSGSVRAGLEAVPPDATVIVVHDAARPAASSSLFRAVVEAVVAGADAAVPGVGLVDTVKRVGASGIVEETLDRERLVAVQTPQAFSAVALRRAHAGDAAATDDAALVERLGGRVVVVEGEPGNRKLTTPDDLIPLAEALRERVQV
ncbi:MAG TPA: 2-C-methyl-D-erythritol 4-phosphate cytidylyltransferase [Acidimicrobiales bacterium]